MGRSKFQAGPQLAPMVAPDAQDMALTAPLSLDRSPSKRTADVEIVVPVYNEEQALASSIGRLQHYLTDHFPFSWVITIADNASTDTTWGTACRLAQELDGVRAIHIGQKGRGRALRTVWATSTAAVVAYMDVDLSTDLGALLPLVAPLITGHSDVAIGSRLAQGARVVRGPKREAISRMYNLVLRATLHNSFSDAQCGFKALRSDVARRLLPLVEDNGWFFDTELLVLAERNGLRVHEVAVDWVDDPDSRVDIVSTAREDLKGVARMLVGFAHGKGRLNGPVPGAATEVTTGPLEPGPRGRRLGTGQAVHFAGVGVVSTVAFGLLFALLYGPLGVIGADVVALALCAVGNLAANRRYTFAASGPVGRRHYYTLGASLALLPLATNLLGLGVVQAVAGHSLVLDLVALTVANLSASVTRFSFLRRTAAFGEVTGISTR